MENDKTIDRISPNLYTYHYEDGFWEILSGVILLVLAILYMVDKNPTSIYSLIIVLFSLTLQITLYQLLKFRITVPRVGKKPLNPAKNQNSSRKILIIIASFVFLISIVLIFLSSRGFISWDNSSSLMNFLDEKQLIMVYPGFFLIGIIIFSIKMKKFTIDIVLLSIAISIEIIVYILGLHFSGFSILFAGCFLVFIGAIQLKKFLQKYQNLM